MVSRRAQRWLVVARRRGAVVLTLAALLSLGVSGATFSVSTSNSAQSFASASAFDYATLVTAATPWLWWRLGDTGGTTTADGSGNSRTGTLSTAGIARGGDGAILQDSSTSFAFDGSAGCLAASATHANPTTFSVEAWFRTTSTTGGLIVGFEGSSALASGSPTTYDRQVFLTAAGNVAFGMKTSSPVTVTSPGAYNDGQWHYVTATFGGGGQKLYLDGVLAASNANTSAATLTATWHAGCGTVNTGFTGAPSTGYLQANLDEVALYTSELSATAVANRMTAAPPHQPWFDAVQSSRPWGWWRMADSSGTTLADASGNSVSGTTSGSGITRAQTGAIATNSAMTFNGSAGCAVVSTAVVNPTTFSVEAWFRTTTTSGGWIVGFSANASANATASFAHDRNVYMTNSGTLVFGTYTGSVATISTTSAYNDGAWHHVVASLSSAGQRLYVDGALSASAATTAAEVSTGYWHIGCAWIGTGWPSVPSSYFLNGTIDEVAVYTEALTATTVAAHYRAGSSPPSYTADVLASSPWLYWHLDQLAGHGVLDSSGNTRDGWTSNGGVTTRASSIVPSDGAINLDGSTGCIVANSAFVNPTIFSLEAWFRTTTAVGGPIIGGSTASTPDNTVSGDDRHLYMTDAGQVAFVPYDSGVSSYVPITSTDSYNDGYWHHAVATLGTAGRLLYVDGQLVASGGTVTTVNQNHYWKVGCDDMSVSISNRPSSTYFAGDVDEAAIYSAQLSATVIANHYRDGLSALTMPAARSQSGPWATWRLGETSGTTLADGTANGNGATTSASGTTANVDGIIANDAARSFNGSSGCAVSNGTMNSPQTFSIEAWFKTTTTTGGGILALTDGATASNVAPSAWDRLVYMRDDGRLTFGVYPGSLQTVTSTASYNDGAWHQVVATLGASGQKLYLDGAVVASSANTAAQPLNGYWHVGCSPLTGWPTAPTSDYFNATIDEVSIYTVELDAATIDYRYSLVDRPSVVYADAVKARTPTLYWKLDESSGNAADSSGNSVTGTASGSGITRSQPAAITAGTSWSFNGSTGCVVSASSFVNPTTFSIEGWFRTRSTTGAGLFAFTDGSAANTTATNSDRLVWVRDTGTVSFGIYNAAAKPVVTTTATYNDGSWHHVVATVGNDGMKLYVDGSLAASNAATGVQSFTGYWHAGCGKYTGYTGAPTNSWLNGELDEVAIHPTQLSAEAVRWHYLSGLVVRPAAVEGTAKIATIIGTNTASSTGDGGAATSATIDGPYAAVGDVSGNIYVAEAVGCRVRKIAPTGTVTTFAGTGTCSTTGDGGAATSATIAAPNGLAIGTDGSVYIADGSANRVRKVSPAGTMSTYAGTGTASSTGDGGAATSATINSPRGITVDQAGNLYITESSGNRVRKVTSSGTISTIIGNGTASSTGDTGAATSATINGPRDVYVAYDGSIYISDYVGCRVRKISTAGIVTTAVGNGTCSSTGDGGAATSATIDGPKGLTGDVIGNLYIGEFDGCRIRRVDRNGTISTISGTGTSSSTGDGSAASSATLQTPYGIGLDQAGRLLIAEEGNGSGTRIRRIG